MIKIVLIDDHIVVRQGLKKLLKNLGDFDVIAEYENGKQLIDNFNDIKNSTDLFILDYSMPILNGLETLKQIFPIINDEKFLILTQNDDIQLKIALLQSGARGFITKTCSGDELKDAILQISTTGFYNFNQIFKYLQNNKLENSISKILNEKELKFIELVCNESEFTYEQIADRMNLSIKTVDYYRTTLFHKFDLKSKAGLILFSHKHKLTKPFI